MFLRILLALVLACPLFAASVRLVLKDGSYQLVRSYERKGDRVRYYSLERREWEEIPASLVDWKATEEANKAELAERIETARALEREAAEAKAAATGPEVAPGVRLPEEWGAFALYDGKVVTLPVTQAGVAVDKKRTAINILIPAPVLKNRRFVTLPGAQAATRFAKAPEALFVTGRASPDSRFALVKLKPKGDTRELEALLSDVLGRVSHQVNRIELIAEPLSTDTTRLTPRQPLPAGEYAIVEFIDDKLNLYVWDFGVDAAKPRT
jgi:hypothetical protein